MDADAPIVGLNDFVLFGFSAELTAQRLVTADTQTYTLTTVPATELENTYYLLPDAQDYTLTATPATFEGLTNARRRVVGDDQAANRVEVSPSYNTATPSREGNAASTNCNGNSLVDNTSRRCYS